MEADPCAHGVRASGDVGADLLFRAVLSAISRSERRLSAQQRRGVGGRDPLGERALVGRVLADLGRHRRSQSGASRWCGVRPSRPASRWGSPVCVRRRGRCSASASSRARSPDFPPRRWRWFQPRCRKRGSATRWAGSRPGRLPARSSVRWWCGLARRSSARLPARVLLLQRRNDARLGTVRGVRARGAPAGIARRAPHDLAHRTAARYRTASPILRRCFS